ncbi:MAG: segregation and condensation protein A [Actinomycetales bacterium]
MDERAPGSRGAGAFEIHLENFDGPFDLLLSLIAKHKLDVTEIALAAVTDEFVAHIRAMEENWDLDLASDFLVVAATLLDLKAARLLPATEFDDPEDLALLEARDLLFARLLQYRAYKQVADSFADRLATVGRAHPRTAGLDPHLVDLLPELVFTITPEQLAELAARASVPKPEPPGVGLAHLHAPAVSVAEQAELVSRRLRTRGSLAFHELVGDADSTLVVVARFLSLLELFRAAVIAFEQAEALGELVVRWTGRDDEELVPVASEFDDADAAGGEAGRRGAASSTSSHVGRPAE